MDIEKKTHKYTLNRRIAMIEEYELAELDQRNVLLRKYNITISTMARWRKQKRDGLLEPTDQFESGGALSRAERAAFIHLKSENAALRAQLALAESTVDVLGKASALLESLAKSARPAPDPATMLEPAWGQRYQRGQRSSRTPPTT